MMMMMMMIIIVIIIIINCFMYFLKVHWYSSKGPNNNRHCNDFSHMPDFCNFIFQ